MELIDNPMQPPSNPSATDATSASPSRQRFRGAMDLIRPFLALIVVSIIFCVADSIVNGANANFAKPESLRNIAAQTMIVMVAALGMTVVIISGGIDLSVGTAISLCATVLAWNLKEDTALLLMHGDNVAGVTRKLDDADKRVQSLSRKVKEATSAGSNELAALEAAQRAAEAAATRLRGQLEQTKAASKIWTPWTPWLPLPLTLAAGCLCGLLNGMLISQLKLVPFIVTLGTMQLYLGLAKLLADNTTVRPDRAEQVPAWVPNLLSISDKAQWMGLPMGVWITLLLAIMSQRLRRNTP